ATLHMGRAPAPTGPVQVERVTGTLDVRVWDDANKLRMSRRLNQDGALPMQPDDKFRIRVELNQPKYVYVFIIEPDGTSDPYYPWDNNGKRDPPAEKLVQSLELPAAADEGYTRPKTAPRGMQTLVLLVRDKPLPADFDLPDLLGKLEAQPA